MTQSEIVSRLSRLIDGPASDVLYSITMQHVLTAIARRMGDDALSLSSEDLRLALEEVKEVIEHNLDYKSVY